jgi:subtilisin family serine protease
MRSPRIPSGPAAGRVRKTRRRLTCVVSALALVASIGAAPRTPAPASAPASALAAASAPAVAPAPPGPPTSPAQAKISAAVLKEFAGHDTADFWVRLSAHGDTSRAARTRDRTARGQQVVDALRDNASGSQERLRAFLAGKGLRSEAFWITNAVYVKNATLATARRIAAMDGVEEIRAPKVYPPPKPVRATPAAAAPAGVAWGVANINGDDVWREYGKRGEDIVVANIDTGVQYDHPALAGSYRGKNADGTFTHDYNWFDAGANCDGAPCDRNGHGTHTMGTMAGDDGQGDQIGVAPGVKWIAANGCATCTDLDLLESAQWMLAPTDANGEHPDVSKRPHIINNSWGTRTPTDEPLMEDVLEAWAASGIFGVWSNGNNGPACGTSGSPGSRILNYSVGAYDQNNGIAAFSSRGPGQDGETKPNISAPGVNVRSALPGNGYGTMSGTSMAAPHAAGAIALLWSAHPEYARDIGATRTLLDLSAVDTVDTQCGGTADDNDVYGEGRLDALALVRAGDVGLGTLTGTVTDAATGEPIAGATVTAAGAGPSEEARTAADGGYVLRLPVGDHQVTTSAFGYGPATATVHVARDAATRQDMALAAAPRVNLSGVVRDGSGRERPLSATVTAADDAGHTWTTRTDPATGGYRLALLPNTVYTLDVAAIEPGYDPVRRQVGVGAADLTADIALTVAAACTADGYHVVHDGTTEAFTGGRPRDWAVTNVDLRYPGYEPRPGWVFDNPAGRANETGGSGGFAVVDSDHYGRGHVQDTYLTSRTVDMTRWANPAVEFSADLHAAVNSTAAVDLSVDGGRTWATVWHLTGFPGAPGPDRQVVPLPGAAGRRGVAVRLHYLGQWSGWWAVDDLFLGDRACVPAAPAA